MPVRIEVPGGSKSGSPDVLKPFTSHGLEFGSPSGGQAKGDCPFCDKPKFYVNVKTGQFDCKSCQSRGNVYSFFKKFWEEVCVIEEDLYEKISSEKGLLSTPDELSLWLRWNPLTRKWVSPGYNGDGKINQLYRYVKDVDSGKMRWMATGGLSEGTEDKLGLFGLGQGLWNPKCEEVYVCEGLFDGIVLWESMRGAKRTSSGNLCATAATSSSLLSKCSVVCVPGANVWKEQWGKVIAGRRVYLMYDNDHPRKNDRGMEVGLAGSRGARAAVEKMANYAEKPQSIHWLDWSGDGKGYNETIPDGHDIRDMLNSKGVTTQGRVRQLDGLLEKVKSIPADWIVGRSEETQATGGVSVQLAECTSWDQVLEAAKDALEVTEGFDCALSVCLACVMSTKTPGDQVWVRLISPPGTGKSELCEALSSCEQYVYPKSHFKGFFSGYDAGDGKNSSPILEMEDKTLIIKDGDTILSNPDRARILAEARDVYDRVSRSSTRNRMSLNWSGDLTMILAGTGALRELDTSELGERYVTVSITDDMGENVKDRILWKVAMRSIRGFKMESNGVPESRLSPEIAKFRSVTGGYVKYLREHGQALKERVKEPPHDLIWDLINRGKFVAYLRARPSKRQKEKSDKELPTRLVGQYVRLAMSLAAVMGKDEIDQDVLWRVKKCVIDTASGITFDAVEAMYKAGDGGCTTETLARLMSMEKEEALEILRYMRRIKAVRVHRPTEKRVQGVTRWELMPELKKLYEKVVVNE